MNRRPFSAALAVVFLLSLLMSPTAYAQIVSTANATNLQPGAETSARIDNNDAPLGDGSYAEVYRVQLQAGQRYRITMTSDAFDTYLMVLNEGADTVLDSNDDGRDIGTNSQIDLIAQETGTAYIVANTLFADDSGAFSLRFEQVQGDGGGNNAGVPQPQANDDDVPALAVGGASEGTLAQSDIELDDGSYADAYVVNLVAGTRYTMTMRSQSFDTYLLLVDGDFNRVAFNDDAPGLGTDSRIDFTPEAGGEYILLANSFGQGVTGDYRVSLQTLGADETIIDRDSASVQTNMRPNNIPGVGRFHALVLGLDYTHLQGGHLDQCDDDARFIAETLRATVPSNQLDITLLVNEQATAQNFAGQINRIAQQSGPNDIVLIFYSGHGGQDDQPANANPPEADRKSEFLVLYDGYYYDYQLTQALSQTNSRLTMLALDCCFAGGFNNVIDRPGRMGLFSSQEYLVSGVPTDRDEYQRLFGGHLSKLFCAALQGHADGSALDANIPMDGNVTVLEIEKYIRSEWKTVVIDGQYQEPVFVRPAVDPSLVVVSTASGGDTVAVVDAGTNLQFADRTIAAGQTFYSSDFTASAGQRFVIETTDLAQDTDTVLRVLGSTNPDRAMPNDPVLAENDDAGDGSLRSRVEWQCPADGTYYVAVNGFGDNGGTFSLNIQQIGGGGGGIADGGGNNGGAGGLYAHLTDLHIQPESSVYTNDYDLVAGRTYRVSTSDLSEGCDTVVELRGSTDPDVVGDNDPVVAENDDANGTLASELTWTCAQSGKYYVAIRGFGNSAGTFSLTIEEVGGGGGGGGGGGQQGNNLGGNQGNGGNAAGAGALANVNVQLQGAEPSHFGDYQLTAGQVVTVATSNLSSGCDTMVQLRRSTNPNAVRDDDPVVAENDDANGTLASQLTWTVDQTGAYYVTVRSFNGQGGTCTLNVVASGALGPREGLQTERFQIGADTPEYFGPFNLEPGRRVTIETVELSDGLDTVLELRREVAPNAPADGDPMVAHNDDAGDGTLRSRLTWTCTQGGNYYIKVSTFGASTGSCQVQMDFE